MQICNGACKAVSAYGGCSMKIEYPSRVKKSTLSRGSVLFLSSGLRPPLTGIRISCSTGATELAAGESGKPVLFIKGEEHSSSPLFMFHPKNFYFVDLHSQIHSRPPRRLFWLSRLLPAADDLCLPSLSAWLDCFSYLTTCQKVLSTENHGCALEPEPPKRSGLCPLALSAALL